MSSRQAIFDRLRGREVEDVTLPSHDGPWITFADRGAQFQQMVQFVGALVIAVKTNKKSQVL